MTILSCQAWENISYDPPRNQIQVNWPDGWLIQLVQDNGRWRLTDGAEDVGLPREKMDEVQGKISELNAALS